MVVTLTVVRGEEWWQVGDALRFECMNVAYHHARPPPRARRVRLL